jgi:hypothetical protein
MRYPAYLVSCVLVFGFVLSGCGGSHQDESGGIAVGGTGGSGGSGGIVTSGSGGGTGTGGGGAPAQVEVGAPELRAALEQVPGALAAREDPEVLGEVWFAPRVRRS